MPARVNVLQRVVVGKVYKFQVSGASRRGEFMGRILEWEIGDCQTGGANTRGDAGLEILNSFERQ